MNAAARAQQRYQQEAVLSATPQRLLTMLYHRLLLDIDRGEAALRAEDWTGANAHLQHAQAIVAELSATLTDEWSGSQGLRDIYSFLNRTLIAANIGRDAQSVHECRELVAPLRDAWHEAAARLGAASA